MLNFFKHIVSDRRKQLDKQNQIDNLLKTARHKCPQTLIDFFLLERISNRRQCVEVNNSNICEYPDIISKNMTLLESRNNELLQLIKSHDICFILEKHNSELMND